MAPSNTSSMLLECAACHKKGEQECPLKLCSRCKARAYCGNECQKSDWSTHKTDCKRQNYILKITLQGVSDPVITRTLSCPANATFEQLHLALQTAFGFSRTHTYDFKIKDPNAEPEEELDYESYMMRELARAQAQSDRSPMPEFGSRQNLLRIVEERPMEKGFVDGMHDYHRKHSQTPEKYGHGIRLWQVLDKQEYADHEIEYEYDFGDNWEHKVERVGRAGASKCFVCLEGQGHGVAEDVGSRKGWEDLKKAYKAARPTTEQKERMHWYECQASNRDLGGLGGKRAWDWDREKINALLSLK